MSNNSVSHKLTAILYADVADYSRLTGDDEVLPVTDAAYRKIFVGSLIKAGMPE